MTSWNPVTLCECVGSDALGYLTAGLAFITLIWYILIAHKWHESLKAADDDGKKVWGALIGVFLVCAIAGYVSWVTALEFPKIAVIVRIAALALLDFAFCPMFWIRARKYKFHLHGAYQQIGQKLASVPMSKMSDKDLAVYARLVVEKALTRIQSSIS